MLLIFTFSYLFSKLIQTLLLCICKKICTLLCQAMSRSSYLRYVKERNFISTRAFVPILIFLSCVYIYICIEKFQ